MRGWWAVEEWGEDGEGSRGVGNEGGACGGGKGGRGGGHKRRQEGKLHVCTGCVGGKTKGGNADNNVLEGTHWMYM